MEAGLLQKEEGRARKCQSANFSAQLTVVGEIQRTKPDA
jgi:hypothetical protein